MPRMMTVDLINSSSSWPTSSWPWEMPQSRRTRLTCRTRCWWTVRPPSLSAWCLQRYESVRGQSALPTSHALHGLRVRKYPGHRHHPPPGHPLQRPDDPTQQHVVQAGPNGNLDCVRRSVTDWWCWHTSVPVHSVKIRGVRSTLFSRYLFFAFSSIAKASTTTPKISVSFMSTLFYTVKINVWYQLNIKPLFH